MLGGESMKEKKTAAPFVVTFIFIGYASHNTRWDKTETHKASRKRLVRTVLIFTESSDQLSRATDRVPGLPASPGYVQ